MKAATGRLRAIRTSRRMNVLAPVTDLGKWKTAHSRPAVIDALRWNEAAEKIARANINAWLTLTFIWPRVLLRTVMGV